MNDSVPTPERAEIFDLRALNKESEGPKRTKRRWLIGVIAMAVLWALVFVAVDLEALTAGTISALRVATLLIVLAFAGLLLATVLPALPLTQSGADFLRLDGEAIDMSFPQRRPIRLSWVDRRLSMELFDASSTPRTSMLVSSPYFLRTLGTESTLTPEAYARILVQAQNRDLVLRTVRGSRWIYPARVAPIIHHIGAKSGHTSAIS